MEVIGQDCHARVRPPGPFQLSSWLAPLSESADRQDSIKKAGWVSQEQGCF